MAKQERQLQRAKAEQQKAELAAKRRQLLHRERAVREEASPSNCDPDEGMRLSLHPSIHKAKEGDLLVHSLVTVTDVCNCMSMHVLKRGIVLASLLHNQNTMPC